MNDAVTALDMIETHWLTLAREQAEADLLDLIKEQTNGNW
ncbi:hypothetical protein [Xanthomonas phage JGB6]|nr:hypothetical protein [Xanthomonas phage JGB6]